MGTRTPKTFKIEYKDDDSSSGSPTPSTASSGGGSAYTPDRDTTDGKIEEKDEKPDIDDDIDISDDGDEDKATPSKKRKSPTKSKRPVGTPTKANSEGGSKSPAKAEKGGARGKVGAWTGEEDWRLFEKIHPRVSAPNWGEVGAYIGRDAKNRYAIFKKRLEQAIKGNNE